MEEGSILEVLNFIKVKPGDTFAIRPGTIHAIGKGVRLFEIQQNSVLTYRLYDYLRKDKDGNYRELHIDKALDVINLKKHVFDTIEGELLTENEYFSTSKKVFTDPFELKADNSSYITFTFLDGEGFVDGVAFNRFDTFFLPANKACTIKGSGSVIISHVPTK
jgi:mannose-6-phosphate isomerase